MAKTLTLYERIGEDLIRKVITEFYLRAFADPIIGHFFFEKDRAHITAMQIDFAINMLGGPRNYKGKPLVTAHEPFDIRGPHFGRRQVLMREVLDDLVVAPELSEAWLALEGPLRALVVRR